MKKRQQKKLEKKTKIETKDFGANVGDIGVPATITDSSHSETPQTSISYWPAANLWYAQGKDAAKKAYFDYINAMNQYFAVPDDQADRKFEIAGKMNSLISSMIQGVAIGTDAAENAMRKVRIGDQSAVLEKDVIVQTLQRILKTIHTHNQAAYSGKLAGLEVKLIEPSLMSRVNRIEDMGCTSMGIPLANAEEADTLWVEDTPVNPMQEEVAQDQDDIPLEDIQTDEQPPGEELTPEEREANEEDISISDAPETTTEEVPAEDAIPQEGEGEEELPSEEMATTEETPDDEFPLEDEDAVAPEEKETVELPADEVTMTDESPEEIPESEEMPVDETEQMQEEVPVDQETLTEEVPVDEQEVPGEEGTEEALDPEELKAQLVQLVDEDPEKAAALLAEATSGEEEDQVEGEPQIATFDQLKDEGAPEEEVAEEETPEEDNLIYCYQCDRDTTEAERASCEDPACPFKQQEEEVSEEVPEEKKEKHFIMVDCKDHSDCDVRQIIIKDFTGVEGDYCLTCGKLVNYAFDQDTWTSHDAKAWAQKQFKIQEEKNKTSEEIVLEKIDTLTDLELKEWLSPKEESEDELDLDPQEVMDTMEKVLKEAFRKQIIEPFEQRLKDLEA